MTHPFERWPRTGRTRALIAVIVAALAMQAVLTLLDGPLRATGDGTVSFELAGSTARAAEIVDAWRAEDVLANAAFIDGLDFLFAPLYGAAIAGACVAASAALRRRGRGTLAVIGIAAAWAATGATGFDWIENIALATALLDEPAAPWPSVALVAAIPKFAGIAFGLLYVVGGGVAALATGRGHLDGESGDRPRSLDA